MLARCAHEGRIAARPGVVRTATLIGPGEVGFSTDQPTVGEAEVTAIFNTSLTAGEIKIRSQLDGPWREAVVAAAAPGAATLDTDKATLPTGGGRRRQWPRFDRHISGESWGNEERSGDSGERCRGKGTQKGPFYRGASDQ
jgi:hypothetical protein